jgi:uncharacterized membrane protein
MSPSLAFTISVLGNISIAFILLLFLEKTAKLFSRHSALFKKYFWKLLQSTQKRHQSKFNLLAEFALIVIVATPLPFTGAWSGCLAAFVFGIPRKKSFVLISIGVIIAGVIVLSLTLAGQAWWYQGTLI